MVTFGNRQTSVMINRLPPVTSSGTEDMESETVSFNHFLAENHRSESNVACTIFVQYALSKPHMMSD